MYVIRRTDQGGGYVAKPGSRSSYTKSLARAEKFPDRETAEGHSCPENERAVNLEHLLDMCRH